MIAVTDKMLDDLEFLAVRYPDSKVIHVMKTGLHIGPPGGHPKTVCGRDIEEMFIIRDLDSEDRPCKLCERTMPVISIMFETTAAVGQAVEAAERYNEQMAYMSWLSHGISFGYVSPPFCAQHNPLPVTEDEAEDRANGEDPCIYVTRIYGSGVDDMDDPHGEVS